LSKNNTWEDIDSLNITFNQNVYEIKSNKRTLLCAKDHILIDENGNEVFACDSLGKNIQTIDGFEKIISV